MARGDGFLMNLLKGPGARLAELREQERRAREALRAAEASQREAKWMYDETRQQETDDLNKELEGRTLLLRHLLVASLEIDTSSHLTSLKTAWEPPSSGPLAQPAPPLLVAPEAPRGLLALLPSARRRHKRATALARANYENELTAYQQAESLRRTQIDVLKARFQAQIDEWFEAIKARDPESVVFYFRSVLRSSPYPSSFPRDHRLAYIPESHQLIVEQELPPLGVVPAEKCFRYVKARGEIAATERSTKERRDLYASVLSQSALRTVREVFDADLTDAVETLVLNGVVSSIDPRTGKAARPCLITLRATRAMFEGLDLRHVDPAACLRYLNASVSKSPTELAAVRPVIEFDMIDRRFVQESDILSHLDQRPNLMELTPTEFESLITNLFEKMGLETRMTQASRDGGVDCVAYDPRSILGGKVVIQAKRYKHTVGVSAVRDLYGTMHNEGASKGILVTTSGYGPASFEFAAGKPLELLSGTHLLYLLKEHAGVDARIEPPEEWNEPEGAIIELK